MTASAQTNWIAITGAPSSGKTSVINQLLAQGYAVLPEVARAYIEEQLATGRVLSDIRGQDAVQDMQRAIFTRKRALEAAQDPAALIFLDRGLPDSIAYYRLAGLDPAPVIAACHALRYRRVFVFDPLPVVHDTVRTEDDAAAQQLEDMFIRDYASLGYTPVHVPVMPVADRTNLILRNLGLPALPTTVPLS